MTIFDLLFITSILLILVLAARAIFCVWTARWHQARRAAWQLGLFVAAYGMALACSALLLPRRFYAPGERRCFDDWCIAALSVSPVDSSNSSPCRSEPRGRTWIAEAEVSSDARAVRQRASDARLELEDAQGKRYQACLASPATSTSQTTHVHQLSDELDPGESFRVALPFRLPATAQPAGVVIHHGDVPGLLIIGSPHSPALMRFQTPRTASAATR